MRGLHPHRSRCSGDRSRVGRQVWSGEDRGQKRLSSTPGPPTTPTLLCFLISKSPLILSLLAPASSLVPGGGQGIISSKGIWTFSLVWVGVLAQELHGAGFLFSLPAWVSCSCCGA